jgi:hypothetical protein
MIVRAPKRPDLETQIGPVAGVVLDRPVADAADGDHLAALVLSLFEGGVSHLNLVGAGVGAAPEAWPVPGGGETFQVSATCDLAGKGEVHHYSAGAHRLSLLPASAGRTVVVAAARLMAERHLAEASVEALDATVAEIAGPPMDLVIVTGGTMNLAGAYTWSAAYAEFIFLAQPWRDLAPEDLVQALREFAQRSRRFGGIAVAEHR